MRTLLAHIELSPSLNSVLETARLVAEQFDSFIEGYYIRPSQPELIAAGADGFVAAAPELVTGLEREAQQRAEEAHRRFLAFCRRHGLSEPPAGRLSAPAAVWHEEQASGHGAIGSRGRIFDLIVVARPISGALTPSAAALEAALFESGRPLLVAPPGVPSGIGRRIVVAWNGSTETARAVALSMPFLKRAQSVVVLTVEGGSVPGPEGDELAARLRLHDIAVERRHSERHEAGIGEAILEECRVLEADLLVKGAYTQSRLRQMIFGGATSHILGHAELPVLLAN